MQKPFRLTQAEHNVHILNRTARLTFDQVIDQAHHDQFSGPFINIQGKIAEVAAANMIADLDFFRAENPNKGFIAVKGS